MPVSDVMKKHQHEDDLDMELRFRHMISYLPFGESNARTHPVPALVPPNTVIGRPFCELTFSQKKNLLMVDEERRWRIKNPEADIKDFDSKTFEILCPDVVFKPPNKE